MSWLGAIKLGRQVFGVLSEVIEEQRGKALTLTELRQVFARRLSIEVQRGALDPLIIRAAEARSIINRYVERG